MSQVCIYEAGYASFSIVEELLILQRRQASNRQSSSLIPVLGWRPDQKRRWASFLVF